jgi:hypothetical protein
MKDLQTEEIFDGRYAVDTWSVLAVAVGNDPLAVDTP